MKKESEPRRPVHSCTVGAASEDKGDAAATAAAAVAAQGTGSAAAAEAAAAAAVCVGVALSYALRVPGTDQEKFLGHNGPSSPPVPLLRCDLLLGARGPATAAEGAADDAAAADARCCGRPRASPARCYALRASRHFWYVKEHYVRCNCDAAGTDHRRHRQPHHPSGTRATR